MPRILIAGCGYVGQAVADLFHAAGWTVEGWTHSAESAARLSANPYPVRGVDVSRRAQVAEFAGIYGPGRSALVSKFIAGTAVIDPEIDRFVNQVHRDDSASALFFLLSRKVEGAQIYNVVDDQPILQSECYRWLAHKLNRPLPPIGKSKGLRKRGDSNKRVSNAKLRRLGWTPRYPTFVEAMEKSILPSFADVIWTSSH